MLRDPRTSKAMMRVYENAGAPFLGGGPALPLATDASSTSTTMPFPPCLPNDFWSFSIFATMQALNLPYQRKTHFSPTPHSCDAGVAAIPSEKHTISPTICRSEMPEPHSHMEPFHADT
eukprot:4355555-Pyramimonas_sp.AAC.1